MNDAPRLTIGISGGIGRATLARPELLNPLSKPVVAAVQGRAVAGGAGLATACDMVLAREDATFGYPEVRLGSVPAMVMTMLRRSVGEKHAFDLVASGRMVGAAEAERLGLVSRVLSMAAFSAEVERIVLGLASHSTTGMATTKRLFYALDGLAFCDAIDVGVRTDAEANASQPSRNRTGD